jgi:phosphonate transport system ATP-binding protein
MAAAPGAAARAEPQEPARTSTAERLPSASVGIVACTVRGLRKSFNKDVTVLDGIDLFLPHGQSVALIGANGTGKSTLLRCLVRLIEPSDGDIFLLDRDVRRLGERQLRRLRAQVGFIFQRHNLVPRLSVLSNVVHGAQARHGGPRVWYQGLAPAPVRAEAMHCLERVGLADLARRRADQLSGGQSQRVAVARALMQRPAFVIADEPVASLDPAAGLEVMQLFTELLREDGITLLFTSHHLGRAVEFSDRIVGLRQGRISLDLPSAGADIAELRAIYD